MKIKITTARNHLFVDGNKRTAHVAYRTFLVLNGADVIATDEENIWR
jgi:death on curing protein